MKFFEELNGSLIFHENGETVMLTPWGENSLRVRARILQDIDERNAALLDPKPVQGEIAIGETQASIRCGNLVAELNVNTAWSNALQIVFKDRCGKVLLSEQAVGGALLRKARHFRPLAGNAFRLTASFTPEPGEKIYGMGQYQQEVMDLKGCSLELAQRNSQASIPFYVSSLGYGFLWNNPAIGEVHFGTNVTQWTAETTQQLDYWITAADTPAEIMEAYALATGKPPMMPEYGLGFWQCKLRYYNQEQVLKVAREYKRRGIPVDVFVIDFYHWPHCGDWKFDEEFFPDPAAMVKELHDMGMETMVSIWPKVDPESENFEEMRRKGMLVRSERGVDVQMVCMGDGVFADMTNPRTREFVWDKVRENYASLGVRTYWLDVAEPEYTGYAFEQYRYHSGSVLETGNVYPLEYAKMFYEGMKDNGQDDIVSLIRCAWAGSQRYGALVWSGDIMSTYEDFRKQICAGIHMGLSGIPWWTTDIGGFHGGVTEDPAFRELLVRWFQFGAFCPVMRLHGSRRPDSPVTAKDGRPCCSTGYDNEIWSFGDENYPILVRFIRLRERMRDYTRSLMRTAHETGAPVIRAMFYEFPEDAACWNLTDQYMYGPDILVAPVCHEGARSRSVYLPEGAQWTDARTGEVFKGGQTIEADAPVSSLPVFLRDGKQDYLIGQL